MKNTNTSRLALAPAFDPELGDLQISILRNVLSEEYERLAGISKRSTGDEEQDYTRQVNAVALLLHQLQ
jgi:hypothetical protein